MIHVSQRDQMWEKIVIAEPPPDHMTYKPGWKVSCYDTAMTQFLRIASECVYPTRGSEAFISAYNEAGPNFRERFQLCIEFLQQQGRCPNGRNCPQIHAFCADASHVQAHETHVAQDARCLNYMRLPAEKGLVRVYKPNDVDAYDVVPSQYIIYTSGSEVYRSDGTMPRKKMQHCAHFANKRLCNRGVQCSFIHVIPREFWDEQSKAAVGLSSPNRPHSRHPSRRPSSQCRSLRLLCRCVPFLWTRLSHRLLATPLTHPLPTSQQTKTIRTWWCAARALRGRQVVHPPQPTMTPVTPSTPLRPAQQKRGLLCHLLPPPLPKNCAVESKASSTTLTPMHWRWKTLQPNKHKRSHHRPTD